jgi:hypothetical protein
MKNKILSTLAIAATIVLSLIMSSSTILKAPPSTCGPYTIFNEMGCTVKISYVRTCNGSPCVPLTNISIGPNSQIVIPNCSCPSGLCDVSVTLISVNGSSTGLPLTVNSTNTSASYTPPICAGSGGNLVWGTTFTTIN